MSKNNASLLEAARSGDIKRVQNFLSAGASPSVSDGDGTTALMFAANSGYTEIVRILIDSGANINYQRKSYGLTALMLACATNKLDIVRLLISKGADINSVNED
ncbi:MAG: ankyrin repeat domain-containing protein, partial [Rivularia sp. (in: cyanobacteria)]